MQKQKFYRSVAVFILQDNRSRVLLQHKAKDSKVLPNQWAFFGGSIEKSETPEQAMRREAKEELGIKLKNMRFLGRYEAPFEGGLWEQFVFVGKLANSLETLKRRQTEGQGVGLFAYDELKSLKINKHITKILDDAYKLNTDKNKKSAFGILRGLGPFTQEDEMKGHEF